MQKPKKNSNKKSPETRLQWWIIHVDETPEPWEDYSVPHTIVYGTSDDAQIIVDRIKSMYEDVVLVTKRVVPNGARMFIGDKLVHVIGNA